MRSDLGKVLFERDVGKRGGTVQDVIGKYCVFWGGSHRRGRTEKRIGSAGKEI